MNNSGKIAWAKGAKWGVGVIGIQCVIAVCAQILKSFDLSLQAGSKIMPSLFGSASASAGEFLSTWSIATIGLFIITSIALFLTTEEWAIDDGRKAVASYSVCWAVGYIPPALVSIVSIETAITNVFFALLWAIAAIVGVPVIQKRL